ncbi:MAG: hypothetical protein C4547_06375 [Phycisphaerales bacterium]|nr:MAG: hypothetical protein C4547_06375 [Phycisphaerales bacterium]
MAGLVPGRRFDRFWLYILLVPPLLIFPNMGASILWQDEAETALLARRIAQYGYPLADDGRPPTDPMGRSVYAVTDQKDFVDLNEDGIWIWTSWLGNYVAAASFLVFDRLGLPQSTLAARLPFALVGWAVFAVMYAGLRDVTGDRRLARLAVVLLSVSVPYLLFTRQCRNYTLLALFTFLQTWGYIRLLRGRQRGLMMFVVGGVGSYYAFFVQMVGATAGMGLHLLLRHPRWRLIARFVAGCVLIALFTLPFFVYTRSWDRDYDGSGFPAENVWRFAASLRAYVLQIQLYAWPFALLVPLILWKWAVGGGLRRRGAAAAGTAGVAALLWSMVRGAGPVSFSVFLGLVGVVGLAALVRMAATPGRFAPSGESGERPNWLYAVGMMAAFAVLTIASLANYPFFRYLVGLAPWFAAITALCLLHLAADKRWLLAPAVVVLAATEFVQYAPVFAARQAVLEPQRLALAVKLGTEARPNHDLAYYRLNEFGHLQTNGNVWTILYKDARGGRIEGFPEIEFPLYEYIYELTHDYDGPIEAVVAYLNEHAQPGDTVVTVYEHFPLKFYTTLPVFRPWETYTRLWDLPDWIVRQHQGYPGGLHPRVREERYEMIEDLPGDPRLLQWDNIPEPMYHQFRTLTDRDELKLWRLKDQYKAHPATRQIPSTLTLP